MRAVLAGVCPLLLLTACGGADVPAAAPAPPSSAGPVGDEQAGGDTAECTHPAGFTVTHPGEWSVNPGEVLPVCSWFAADSFSVPRATDVRLADITVRVESGVALSAPLPDETARIPVDVAGRPAVRLEQVAGPGFYPDGTPVTTYIVELAPGSAAGEVLVARTVGLPAFDYERNVEVLEEMMASLVWDAAADV